MDEKLQNSQNVMKLLYFIKDILRPLYNKLFRYYIGDVIVLHRVVDGEQSKATKNKLLEIQKNELVQLINQYRNDGYEFVSLDVFMKEKNRLFTNKRIATITFDDGYRDNYAIAYPLLKELKAPFSVFISIDIIEQKAALWWYVLEDILWSQKEIILDGKTYTINTDEEKNDVFDIVHAKPSGLDTKDTVSWFKKNGVDWDTINTKYIKSICMTWSELQAIAKDSLCTVGSHTLTHARLPLQSTDVRINELKQSKSILEERLNCNVHFITYPYGACSAEVESDVRKIGYAAGFLSRGGSVRKDQNRYRITRTKWNQ